MNTTNFIIAIKRHDSEEIVIYECIEMWRAVRFLSEHLAGEYDFRMADPDEDSPLEYAEEYKEHMWEQTKNNLNEPKQHLVTVKEL